MANSLVMGWPDGSLPQVVYSATQLLSCRRWRQSQVLADQFWSRFIHDYLPDLQSRQKWHSSPAGHIRAAEVNIKGQVYTRPVARLVVLPSLSAGEKDILTTPANTKQK
ncbi:hypothetical protein N1851_031596 [Merluccius polli]|uniref:DUF5641 domain-containing protein n=1 Tax=Merluccius polli TaxID=89951 RepID=A0AA47M3T5_MERPO|nr:hypothetical protein N1851_031596 [Merluccius polli]